MTASLAPKTAYRLAAKPAAFQCQCKQISKKHLAMRPVNTAAMTNLDHSGNQPVILYFIQNPVTSGANAIAFLRRQPFWFRRARVVRKRVDTGKNALNILFRQPPQRSEERRVGKAWGRRWTAG